MVFRIFFVFLLVVIPAAVSAQVKGWDAGDSSKVTMRDLIPKMSSDEAYSDRYTFHSDLDGGGHINVEFTVSNLGWGDHHGAAVIRASLPGGKRYVYAERFDSGDWSYSKKEFKLDIGKVSIRGKGKATFVIKHTGDVPMELTIKSRMPMWSPGRGAIEVGDQKFALALIAPRADLTGRVQIDGSWKDVRSTGKTSGDYNYTQFAPFDLAKRFSRFQDFNGDVFVAWRSIQLTKENGGKTLTWLVIGYKNQIIFSDANARIRESAIVKDRKSGYPAPKAMQIDAADGDDRVKLVMRGNSFRSIDMLEDYNAAIKLFAKAMTKPVQLSFKGEYQLQMTIKGTTANVAGKEGYSMDYMK